MKGYFISCVVLLTVIGLAHAQNDSNWQSRIDTAFVQSFLQGSSQLTPLVEELEMKSEASDDPMTDYWLAYAHYRSGIYHMAMEDMDAAEEQVSQGIAVLTGQEMLTSEDDALLGTLISMSIIFSPGEAMVLSAKSNKYFQEAIDKDNANPRAYLGLGRADFYRPTEYGGGLVAEKHLQKALSLSAKNSDDPQAPDWGRDEIFWYLAQYYQREGRNQEAILTCKRGLKEYPGHEMLHEILAELQN
jgi:tetratricopeptide (TPR) repeat protein